MSIHDARAIGLPPQLMKGLRLLIARTLGLGNEAGASAVVSALFGDEPTFGHVGRCSTGDVRAACARLSVEPPLASTSELAGLLARIAPETPVCGSCGELPLTSSGGSISELPAGSRCPFCPSGRTAVVPVAIKVLAWTDGRLVDPDTRFDLRSRPGEKIPLKDDDIVAWAGGWIEPRLERALKKERVPVSAFLAHQNLAKGARDRLDVADLVGSVDLHLAATLLQRPAELGLASAKDIEAAVRAAKAFAAEREVTNLPSRPALTRRLGRTADEAPRVVVDGRAYLIEGRIGSGDKCDVYRGLRDRHPTEAAIIKICRDAADADLMEREAATLRRLGESRLQGSQLMTRFLPRIVAAGPCAGDDGIERRAIVLRDKNMFDWTVADAIREYPSGVDPETMVWMWNRTLMLLAWVHRNGLVHAALFPSHILIHPLNHGATFVDWSYAVPCGAGGDAAIDAFSAANEPFYPAHVLTDGRVTRETDIAMSARSMIAVLGGDPATGRLPRSVPGPLADILKVHGQYGSDPDGRRIADALELHEAFGRVAGSVYGKRRYHPFIMPARRR
jgi:hypothetical protein